MGSEMCIRDSVDTDQNVYVQPAKAAQGVKGSVTKEQMNALDAEGAAKPTLTITAYASQLYKNATETFSASEAWNNIANK